MIFPQRQDGEPVQHHAGAFGMHVQRRCRRDARRSQGRIHRLYRIVPELVVPVYRPLRLPDALRGQIIAPRKVLLVPQQEVLPVVLHHPRHQPLALRRGRLDVPQPRQAVVRFDELEDVHVVKPSRFKAQWLAVTVVLLH